MVHVMHMKEAIQYIWSKRTKVPFGREACCFFLLDPVLGFFEQLYWAFFQDNSNKLFLFGTLFHCSTTMGIFVLALVFFVFFSYSVFSRSKYLVIF